MTLPTLLLSAWIAAVQEQAPVSGDCSRDPAAWVSEAQEALSRGAEPDAEAVARARELYRRARRLTPSVELALRSADLAALAGDSEEEGDLLSAVAEEDPRVLSTPELTRVARRAEARRQWREAIARWGDLLSRLGDRDAGAEAILRRLRELEVEEQAAAIAPPGSLPGPSVEARLALADGKRALALGRLREAREKLRLALQLSPSYVEALLALAAVETRAGATDQAIRAYRAALAEEPARFEGMVALATLLWNEPDRRAKEESLELLDRAIALRPEMWALLRTSAQRWADRGDAAKALERLDRYREAATPAERRETDALRETLSRRVRGVPEEPPAETPKPEEPASAAVDRWRKAQVYVARGDPASLDAALALLVEAERLDPVFARAPELAAAIYEQRGEWGEAERALRRAAEADPSRVGVWEGLGRLIDRDSGRTVEAEEAWRRAETAGSTEALFALARAAERRGRPAEAEALYRRYGHEAPAGPHAEEARSAAMRIEQTRRRRGGVVAGVVALGALIAGGLAFRLLGGKTFTEWMAADPSRAAEARPIVGRLRHETLKHGGLLLEDAASRLDEGDESTRRETAELLIARLYGDGDRGGLVRESERALEELRSLARQSGVRLNSGFRDPVLSRIARGLARLSRVERDLRRIASSSAVSDRAARRAASRLRAAARAFASAAGVELDRALDAAALAVDVSSLRAILSRVAAESGVPDPGLELHSGLDPGTKLPRLRVDALDWETLWRNLFTNALAAAEARDVRRVRLGLAAEKVRDPVTGEPRLRLVLADNLPGSLTTEAIRGRSAGRGWGVVSEILRRNDGSVEVASDRAAGFTKGIVLNLPAVEEP